MRGRRTRYGAGPRHLVAMAVFYLIAIYSTIRLLSRHAGAVTGWFIGAAVGHDLLLLPAYLLADAALVAAWRRRPTLAGCSWLHHVRWPLAISLLLLLIFAPEILRINPFYSGAADLSSAGYLGRWATVAGILFGLSAAAFVMRVLAARHRP